MPAPQQEILDRQALAIEAAREAGRLTLNYFRQEGLAVQWKHDASPVTVADREAEQHLRQRIAAAFPNDGILGEEFGEQPGTSGYRWILDPIDGTKSFVSGVPLYGTLVGVELEGRSRLGVIVMPALDEYAYAAEGAGAWYVVGAQAARPARVSAKRRLAEGLFCTSEIRTFSERGRADAFQRIQSQAWLTRTWGDCYGYLLVATGRAEAMVDPKMNVWDCAALQPILEQAGGTFTDWSGNPTIHAGESVATNGQLLDEVLELLGGSNELVEPPPGA
ncbi:MAG TPA: histidinol-phosphatase [Pirellulales bacterium]|jgi:histidinol phosphatase-like enzyme (inositol monophosphatase family)|nr:histidinol-phosphatase [Pirellulales bacterium]